MRQQSLYDVIERNQEKKREVSKLCWHRGNHHGLAKSTKLSGEFLFTVGRAIIIP